MFRRSLYRQVSVSDAPLGFLSSLHPRSRSRGTCKNKSFFGASFLDGQQEAAEPVPRKRFYIHVSPACTSRHMRPNGEAFPSARKKKVQRGSDTCHFREIQVQSLSVRAHVNCLRVSRVSRAAGLAAALSACAVSSGRVCLSGCLCLCFCLCFFFAGEETIARLIVSQLGLTRNIHLVNERKLEMERLQTELEEFQKRQEVRLVKRRIRNTPVSLSLSRSSALSFLLVPVHVYIYIMCICLELSLSVTLSIALSGFSCSVLLRLHTPYVHPASENSFLPPRLLLLLLGFLFFLLLILSFFSVEKSDSKLFSRRLGEAFERPPKNLLSSSSFFSSLIIKRLEKAKRMERVFFLLFKWSRPTPQETLGLRLLFSSSFSFFFFSPLSLVHLPVMELIGESPRNFCTTDDSLPGHLIKTHPALPARPPLPLPRHPQSSYTDICRSSSLERGRHTREDRRAPPLALSSLSRHPSSSSSSPHMYISVNRERQFPFFPAFCLPFFVSLSSPRKALQEEKKRKKTKKEERKEKAEEEERVGVRV